MHLSNKTLIILGGAILTLNLFAEEIVENKWRLSDEVLENKELVDSNYSRHSLKFGLGSKNIQSITLEGSKSQYTLADQDLPGLEMAYGYDLSFETIESTFYTNIGYFTRYNKLSEGYADFSAIGMNLGLSIGYSFFQKIQVTPKLFAGVGSSYYFQNGDTSELSANESIQELEYGLGLDFMFKGNNPYPESWGNHLLLSLQYSKFEGLGSKEIEGDKVLASLGVQL